MAEISARQIAREINVLMALGIGMSNYKKVLARAFYLMGQMAEILAEYEASKQKAPRRVTKRKATTRTVHRHTRVR